MTIKQNKDIVLHYQEIHNENELDRLTEVLSEDLMTPNMMPGIPHGLEGAKSAPRIMLAGFPDYQTILEDLIAEEDGVSLLQQLGVLKM